MKASYRSLRPIAIAVLLAAAVVWTSLPARQVQAIQDSEDFPSPVRSGARSDSTTNSLQ
jgi:hypothetical protein